MNFYQKWFQCRLEHKDDSIYFTAFLEKKQESIDLFDNGSEIEIAEAIKLLLSIPIHEFFKYMNYKDVIIAPNHVLQFSNFDHGVITLCKRLLFANPSSYKLIGDMLIHAKLPGANKKYGENHAKLAQELSFVKIIREGEMKVYMTKLGEVTVPMEESDVKKLSNRLLLRNKFIRKILSYIIVSDKQFNYSFFTEGVLSKSTSDRRKSNIKTVLSHLFDECDEIQLKYKIVW